LIEWNPRNANQDGVDAYGSPHDNVYTSPLLHSKLAELPRTYLNACGMDTLRDDAVLFKEAIEKAG